jgi:hypothetical protein
LKTFSLSFYPCTLLWIRGCMLKLAWAQIYSKLKLPSCEPFRSRKGVLCRPSASLKTPLDQRRKVFQFWLSGLFRNLPLNLNRSFLQLLRAGSLGHLTLQLLARLQLCLYLSFLLLLPS